MFKYMFFILDNRESTASLIQIIAKLWLTFLSPFYRPSSEVLLCHILQLLMTHSAYPYLPHLKYITNKWQKKWQSNQWLFLRFISSYYRCF